MQDEEKRKVRIAAGGLQSIWRLRSLLNIFRYGMLSFQYVSHRVLRWSLTPILLFLLFSLHIMGAGDIKLFSIAGGFLTLTQLCYLIPAAFVVGAVIGAGKIVYKKLTVGYAIGTKTFMHFSTAILIGYFIVVWGWAIA